MKMRIHRTFAWVNDTPLSQVSFGGKPQYSLRAKDTLQYLDDVTGEWKALEVVEEPAPPHPDEVKMQEFSKGIQTFFAETLASAEVFAPEQPEAPASS